MGEDTGGDCKMEIGKAVIYGYTCIEIDSAQVIGHVWILRFLRDCTITS